MMTETQNFQEDVGVDEYRPRSGNYTPTDVAQYNPFASNPRSAWSDREMDRMLTIKKPKDIVEGEIWITETGFAEVLSLMPLSKPEQHAFWKKFRRIQMSAPGELNKRVVASRQERLMLELISQKSRLDAVKGGNTNERMAWITNTQIVEQTLQQINPNQPAGFVEDIAHRLGGY